jgi:hypothetical protein
MSNVDIDEEMMEEAEEQQQQRIAADEKVPARRRSPRSRTAAAARISYAEPTAPFTDSDDILESEDDEGKVPKQRAHPQAARKQRGIARKQDDTKPSPKTARKRGRPKQLKKSNETEENDVKSSPPKAARKRGRPKTKTTSSPKATRKRGRPKKSSISSDDEEENDTSKRKSSTKKRKPTDGENDNNESDVDDSSVVEPSVDDDDDDESVDSFELKPKRKTKSNKTNSQLACPHCHKQFAVLSGLQYHVDHFVCRPAERPGGPVQKGRRKLSSNKAVSEYKRIRGAVHDRTCPHCQRVFTSVHGLNYHRGT